MSKAISRRLLAPSPFRVLSKSSSPSIFSLRCLKLFSSISPRRTEADDIRTQAPQSSQIVSPKPLESSTPRPRERSAYASPSLHPKAATGGMGALANSFSQMVNANQNDRANRNRNRYFDPSTLSSDGGLIETPEQRNEEPHHFHIYATRHNTHITVTRPDRTPIISVSAGNIGFKKSGRKHYDSAFQLASYVMGRMQESGVNVEIKRLEVVLRGFGAGREAVTKALLGTEGRFLRGKVIRVADATRLKFGGTRSKKPRRLG